MSPRMLWTSLVVALLTVAALALVGRSATAAPHLAQASLIVTPVRDVYSPGDLITATVHIDNVEGLFGADLTWAFDAPGLAVVDADGAAPGIQVQPGDLFPAGAFALHQVNNAAGTLTFARVLLGEVPPITGSGDLAIVTFRVTGQCVNTLLTLRPGTLTLSNRDEAPISYQEALPVNIRTAVPACSYRQFLPGLMRSHR